MLLATILLGAVLVAGAAAALVPVGTRLATHSVRVTLPTPSLGQLSLSSAVYDDRGQRIATLSGPEDRAYARLADIAPVLQHAVLAAEDREFYQHGGVDWRGITRAFSRNIDAGAVTQGGSTITQQLVKNTMFTSPKRDVKRKIKEGVLAIALEKRYSKDQILEQYLNTVYFGNGAYGVRAASERYFARPAANVDLAQAALLGALIANPAGRDPKRHADEAARWRDHVLDEMASAGFASAEAVAAAKVEPLPTSLHFTAPTQATDPFVEEVKRELLADPRLGPTYADRYRSVFEGGLRIHTTFDARLQGFASNAAAQLPPSRYTAAMVVVDNTNGAVRAIVPGAGFTHAGFDLATQGARQTGSAFKPFTLAAALEAGFSPNDLVDASAHCSFQTDPNAPPWDVQNYEGEALGVVTLTDAIAKSSNCAFARVALAVGPQHIVDMAHRLGIERPLDAVPSITLGTQEVSPLDMATAFSVFAADGVRHPARFIDRVDAPDGSTLIRADDHPAQVLDPQIARTETEMLTHVLSDGTAQGSLGSFPAPAAGKTGTNDHSRDVWFVGYTPVLTAAVWVGDPSAQVPVVLDGSAQVGGNYPARIWGAFMQAAVAGTSSAFMPPDQSLWPPAGFITETGRNANAPAPPPPPPPPAPPALPPPAPPAPPHARHRHGHG